MANEDLQQEIELLRKQLEEIRRQDRAETASEEEAQQADQQPAESSGARPAPADEVSGEDLIDRLRELLDSIDKDIKDAKPSTLLIVFALGVLVGRL